MSNYSPADYFSIAKEGQSIESEGGIDMASAVRNVVIAKPDPDAIRVENVGDGYFVLCQWDELSQSEQRVVVSADEDRAMLEAILSQKH